MADEANQIFLPWVQPGVAAAIPDQAVERLSSDQAAVLSLPLKLVVNSSTVAKTARLYGPGDIAGIDPEQVVRVEPKPGTTDFEPNYFAAVEFDRPDFPWLFTPAKADRQGQLRPWLCLVVVRKQDGVALSQTSNQNLPRLEIKSPAKPGAELPDLSESHLWAHAQVSGASGDQIGKTLEFDRDKSVSRLLCPRRLDPATDYVACVVPAFEVGRAAGLDDPTEVDTLAPAWKLGDEVPKEITLPVYYSWEFRTSAGGDFEDLVRRLKPRELPPEVGQRPMDISRPGFKIEPPLAADEKGTIVALEGALRVIDRESASWPDSVRERFQTALAEILDTPWELATKDAGDQDPIVGPPVYGCWQAATHLLGKDNTGTAPWLVELNLDPRHRVAAAMGTQVVQQQQEDLMASAWEQLGDIEKINQRLRQAQLSRAVNQKYHTKAFSNFSDEAFLRVVAPAQSRIVIEQPDSGQPKMLLVQKLAGSTVPATAVSAPLRQMSRPRGAVNREFSRAGMPGDRSMFMLFNSGSAPNATDRARRTKGAITIDNVSDTVSDWVARGGLLAQLSPFERQSSATVAQFTQNTNQMTATFRLGQMGAAAIREKEALLPDQKEFIDAASAHHEYLTGLFISFIARVFSSPIVASDLKATILMSLDPARTISTAVTEGATLKSPNPLTGDELDPVMDAPEFPQAMYEALRDLSQDFFFPGLELVPEDTVQLLQTNTRFIESFMVGLNAEMSRELLWRNYPTDQRGTYFRQFWDTAAAGAEAQHDIIPIHQWKDRKLGTTAIGGGDDQLVLLIRGELLRRYPGTVIYAVKAMLREGKRVPAIDHLAEAGAQRITSPLEAYPIFRGSLEPDVTFVGFNLTATEVLAGNGWFFVLQQQPTEPRFGLDEFRLDNDQAPRLKTWNDLNWAHLAPSLAELEQLSHVKVGKLELKPESDRGTWNRNSAHMAYITKQVPARIAIHARELIHQQQTEGTETDHGSG